VDQFVKGAAFDDAALLEHKDAGGIAHRCEPVRDHEGGSALHYLVERGVHLPLGRRIKCTRGFVEDQDRRIFQKCARDREPLALTAGQGASAFPNDGAQSAFVGFAYILVRGIAIADA